MREVSTTEALMTDPTTPEGQAYWQERHDYEERLEQLTAEELRQRRSDALAASADLARNLLLLDAGGVHVPTEVLRAQQTISRWLQEVTVCRWCPGDGTPLAAHHPGGQAEHVKEVTPNEQP